MDRRDFLRATSVGTAALAGLSACAQTATPRVVPEGENPFQHGVASGDPLSDRVILWTRVSPEENTSPASIAVSWWVARDVDGDDVVSRGRTVARAERDFTVKVDATGLAPGSNYFYGFEAAGFSSRVGRTKTLPVDTTEAVRMAVTSCANYPQGYFNAYRAIADTVDLDVVLSLGDYIYEYANGEYGDGMPLDRVSDPLHEIISIDDYRARHAQHKAEPDLQDAHAAHPWIVIWDDHESANNSWADGAENHDDSEGDWETRKTAAIASYYEWMPIRELPTGLYRNFRFGDLVDLVMLDTRLVGRDEQVARDDLEGAHDPERSLLGPIQEDLFFDHLIATKDVRWNVVGQQVVFAPWTNGDSPFNPDAWDGYRASRQAVLHHIEYHDIDNVVILTGDVHSAWGMEVPGLEGGNAAIELVTPAVSSPPIATASKALGEMVARAPQDVPHVKFADGMNNGYLLVDLRQDKVRAEWHYTGPRTVRSGATTLGQVLECASGTNKLG